MTKGRQKGSRWEGFESGVTFAGSLTIGRCAEDMLMSWRRVRPELTGLVLAACDGQTDVFLIE